MELLKHLFIKRTIFIDVKISNEIHRLIKRKQNISQSAGFEPALPEGI